MIQHTADQSTISGGAAPPSGLRLFSMLANKQTRQSNDNMDDLISSKSKGMSGTTSRSREQQRHILSVHDEFLPSTFREYHSNTQADVTSTVLRVHPTSCTVCAENFSLTVRPSSRISAGCQHQLSVCTICVERSIASDLENKTWNSIKCPE